jgi:hypothetical protein
MNSPWGSFSAIMERYGWTFDYLLWGISWFNVELMLHDSLRIEDAENAEEEILTTKDDIKNYINGLMNK